jgi:hypothetical protein
MFCICLPAGESSPISLSNRLKDGAKPVLFPHTEPVDAALTTNATYTALPEHEQVVGCCGHGRIIGQPLSICCTTSMVYARVNKLLAGQALFWPSKQVVNVG